MKTSEKNLNLRGRELPHSRALGMDEVFDCAGWSWLVGKRWDKILLKTTV